MKHFLFPSSVLAILLIASTVLALDLDKELNATRKPVAEDDLSSVKEGRHGDVLDELDSVKSHRKKREIERTKTARQQE
ncbi:MAG: hypothetical protein MI743_17195, partial [Sneathiellales bacterium]|nr:hypothetical protein [Sneathiellales bacterium]